MLMRVAEKQRELGFLYNLTKTARCPLERQCNDNVKLRPPYSPGMVARACNPSTWKIEAGKQMFKASTSDIVILRPASTTRDPVYKRSEGARCALWCPVCPSLLTLSLTATYTLVSRGSSSNHCTRTLSSPFLSTF